MRPFKGVADSLWIATDQGIARLSTADVDAWAARRISTIPNRLFDENDGMTSRDCAGGTDPSIWQQADGSLWFATSHGVAVINPAQIQTNSQAPTTLIDEFRVEQAALPIHDSMVLAAGSRSLELHFTATSLAASERNQFRYRLLGFDDQWVEAGNRRVAYYSTLPPGDFRFEVVGSNNHGVWSKQSAVLTFSVLPFFYQQLWFIRVVRSHGCGSWLVAAPASRARVTRE